VFKIKIKKNFAGAIISLLQKKKVKGNAQFSRVGKTALNLCAIALC